MLLDLVERTRFLEQVSGPFDDDQLLRGGEPAGPACSVGCLAQ